MIPMNRDLRRRLAAGALAGGLIAAPAIILSPAVAQLWERAGIEQPSLATDPSLAMLMMMKMSGMLSAGDAGGGGPNIANLFATTLYTGTSGGRTLTNGLDLAGLGGLVWIKGRSVATGHALFDTRRGIRNLLRSNTTAAQATDNSTLNGFTSTGFTLGGDLTEGSVNNAGDTYAALCFARAARFFDVVTWTGDGTGTRAISHALAASPGFIVFKRTDAADNWYTWHQATQTRGALNSTGGFDPPAPVFGDGTNYIAPTNTAFTVEGTIGNANGATYVAYLFAHDTASDGVVQCGSYTGNGSLSGPTITLGWQPQLLITKRADSTSNWWMLDTTRGLGSGSVERLLAANQSFAEGSAQQLVDLSSTGFQIAATDPGFNASGGTYPFVAIRAAA